MERKETKDGCRAPPDVGLFWYLKLTQSVDDGFANERVEIDPREFERRLEFRHNDSNQARICAANPITCPFNALARS
jgi:hypothetical protein